MSVYRILIGTISSKINMPLDRVKDPIENELDITQIYSRIRIIATVLFVIAVAYIVGYTSTMCNNLEVPNSQQNSLVLFNSTLECILIIVWFIILPILCVIVLLLISCSRVLS